ncbi:hypothetical protein Afil01_24020 [Actinorhabdospora filicis]|uniref:Zinc finger CGNR domain-containing protein n=1 Tax=Actinorhabdospora filicis TaxID=1785913 RepID=A0A9W6SKI4_9ACTN|nr:CGNR zinc finger domain-containing protein [Actinorhabdospora filicis]GLZ77595.1 hypothetical protein Afil01_24020 [Actinorhabdospora filicis]
MSYDARHRFCFTTGATWLNLAATVADGYGPDPVERLWDASRLAEWLEHEVGVTYPVDDDDLAHARGVRDALRNLALSAATGVAPSEAAVEAVNEVLAGCRPIQVSIVDGRVRLDPPSSVRHAMGRLAREAVTMLSGDEAAKLTACAEPVCRSVFLDPGGRRRWCPSGRCGVKARVRAFREREKVR